MKTKSNKSFLLLFLSFFIVLLGCTSTAKLGSNQQLVKVADFSFSPENTAAPKSQSIAFVLISPQYAESFSYRAYSPFSDFAKAMGKDVEEVIISRGFSIFGPYDTPDVMVYSDKKNSDLILEISIAPEVNIQNVKAIPHTNFNLMGSSSSYDSFEGTVILKGEIDMTIRAVANNEKLWVKTIPLEQKSIPISSTKKYADNIFDAVFSNSDPGVVNPFIDAMEGYYKIALQTIYAHLDPEEMKNVKAQADEIKNKYQK